MKGEPSAGGMDEETVDEATTTAAEGQEIAPAAGAAATDVDGTAPKETVSAAAATVGDGIGAKLLAKMGYQAGKGLGRENQGRMEPVTVEKRGGEGLGYTNHELAEVNRGIVDSPWFEREDGRSERAFLSRAPASPLRAEDVPASAFVVAKRLQTLNMSKFCRREILEDLHLARLERLPDLLRRLSRLDAESREAMQASCSIAAPSIARALSTKENISAPVAAQALLLAQLEVICDILPRTSTVSYPLGRGGW